MLHRDYLVRMIQMGIEAILKAIHVRTDNEPDLACETIEQMLGSVTEMDPEVLLSLSPESIGTILDLGGAMNDSVAEIVVRGLVLESDVLAREKNDPALAELRFEQARGIATTFHLDFEDISSVISESEALKILDDAQQKA